MYEICLLFVAQWNNPFAFLPQVLRVDFIIESIYIINRIIYREITFGSQFVVIHITFTFPCIQLYNLINELNKAR